MTEEITVDVDAIPDELKERDQWLYWNASSDKPRAPLASPAADYPASWTDPGEWLSFEEVVDGAEKVPEAGIGYVFANTLEEHPRGIYGGLDLDGCVDEDGRPKDWLPSLQPFFDAGAYIEYSPSGDGIHIPLAGFEPPTWWSDSHLSDAEHEGVEAYGKKFFTFTGDRVRNSGHEVADAGEYADDWLAEAYEALTGKDPHAASSASNDTDSNRSDSPGRDRSDLEELETTSRWSDVEDAVAQLEPRDLPLSSSYVVDENDEYESWDPGYRTSESGESLKRIKENGKFIDMMEMEQPFSVLELYAAEEGIISAPYDGLDGDDWHEAVDRARAAGAPIPEYVGDTGAEEVTEAAEEKVQFSPEKMWEHWSILRREGQLDETNSIPVLALEHVAREQELYDFEALPDEYDELPAKAYNRALGWVNNVWPEEVGLDVDDDQDVTARPYKSRDDGPIYTWEDVRYIYDQSKDDGRYAAVNLLRSRYEFLTPEDTENLHVYDEELGIFDRTAKHEIGRELDRNLQKFYSQHEKREIINRLKERTVERHHLEAKQYDEELVCLKNGVLNVETRELKDHDPEYKFTTYLPHEYDPDAVPEETLRFLLDITKRTEDARTLLEMVGHTLLSDYDQNWKQMFMVLFGEGSNGKSTWLEVVRRFLNGIERETSNAQSLTLQQVTDNRFGASNLVGKWANIGEDLPQKKIQDVGTLKDLTGGGETAVEPKGEDIFSFRNRATMMFAANRPPVLPEHSTAVKRRLVPVHLPYEYTENPDPSDEFQKQAADRNIVEQLSSEKEMSGLLNLVLDGIDRLRENQDVSLPESEEERLELYDRYSDHIKAFRVDCLKNEQGCRVSKDDIYNAYTNYCHASDYTKTDTRVFWRKLKQTTLNVTEKRLPEQSDGSRPRVLEGVTFKPEGLKYAPASFQPESEEPDAAGSSDDDDDDDDGVQPDEPEPVALGEIEPTKQDTASVIGEVRFEKFDGRNTSSKGPAWTATIFDTTGEARLVAWNEEDIPNLYDATGLFVADALHVKGAEVGEYDGDTQLVIGANTVIEEAQVGAGHTSSEETEEDQTGLEEADPPADSQEETVADGGQASSQKGRVHEHIKREYEHNEIVKVSKLAGELDMNPDEVGDALEKLATKTKPAVVTDEGGGKYRMT